MHEDCAFASFTTTKAFGKSFASLTRSRQIRVTCLTGFKCDLPLHLFPDIVQLPRSSTLRDRLGAEGNVVGHAEVNAFCDASDSLSKTFKRCSLVVVDNGMHA